MICPEAENNDGLLDI
ncbi:hypothetical protein [Mesobacillus zeae]